MIYILLALIFYCAVIMLGTVASRMADTNLVTAIENIIAGILPIIVAIPILNTKTIQNQKLGLLVALLVGVGLAFFTMFMNKAYSTNKVAIVAPIVFGGSIFITAFLSYFFLKEKITLFQGIGLIILGLGLIFIIYARLTGK